MSKSTKVIAALGVAAGLGIAALPAASFAVQSDTASVGIEVEVTDMIQLSVTGTEDSTHTVDQGADAYVQATMGPNAAKVKTGTAAVVTNNVGGYTLSVAPFSAGSSTLKNGADTQDPEYDTIAPFATAATFTAGTGETVDSFDVDGWGITYTNTGATSGTIPADVVAGKYIGISNSTTMLSTSASATEASPNTTNISYGFQTKDEQKTGTYTGKILYTATNNE